MNEDMPFQSEQDALEARIVAMVLGEASDFEREQLLELISQRPELADFHQQLSAVHGLMDELSSTTIPALKDGSDWRLPAKSRQRILSALNDSTVATDTDPSNVASFTQPTAKRQDNPKEWKLRLWRGFSVVASLAAIVLVSFFALLPMLPGRFLQTTAEFAPSSAPRNAPAPAFDSMVEADAMTEFAVEESIAEDAADWAEMTTRRSLPSSNESLSRSRGGRAMSGDGRRKVGGRGVSPSPSNGRQSGQRSNGLESSFQASGTGSHLNLDRGGPTAAGAGGAGRASMVMPTSELAKKGSATPDMSLGMQPQSNVPNSPEPSKDFLGFRFEDRVGGVPVQPEGSLAQTQSRQTQLGTNLYEYQNGSQPPLPSLDATLGRQLAENSKSTSVPDGDTVLLGGIRREGFGQTATEGIDPTNLPVPSASVDEMSRGAVTREAKELGKPTSAWMMQPSRGDRLADREGLQAEVEQRFDKLFVPGQSQPQTQVAGGKAKSEAVKNDELAASGADPADRSDGFRAGGPIISSGESIISYGVYAGKNPAGRKDAALNHFYSDDLAYDDAVRPDVKLVERDRNGNNVLDSLAELDALNSIVTQLEDKSEQLTEQLVEEKEVAQRSSEFAGLDATRYYKERRDTSGKGLEPDFLPKSLTTTFDSDGQWGVPTEKQGPPIPSGIGETAATDEAYSTFSLHVSDVSFKLAANALTQGQWPDASRVRVEEFVNALSYHDPLPSPDQKVACNIEQAVHPFYQQRNVMRIAMNTAATGRSNSVPLRLTMLLDNSGSMVRNDRKETVQRALASLAGQLGDNDQVTLISFASAPRLVADQINGAQANRLVDLVANLPSEGGTNFESALELAVQKAKEQQLPTAQNRVILLTDGAVNLGDADPNRLSKMVTSMRDQGLAFDAAGISAKELNDDVLETLTRQGDGRYYLLDSSESVESGFAQQVAGALRPFAKNVKVQVEFNPNRVGNYKLLGFEKHLLNKEDFRDDSVDAAEMAAAEAGVAVYQFEPLANGVGDVGAVSVRFQDISTGRMVERRWPIPYDANAPQIDQSSNSLKTATSAAFFAAKLAGGPMAEAVDLDAISSVLSGITAPEASSERIVELRNMVQQARQIQGQ